MYILINISYDTDGQVYAEHPSRFETEDDAVSSAKMQLAEDFGISLEEVEDEAQENGTPIVISMNRDGHFEAYIVAEIPV